MANTELLPTSLLQVSPSSCENCEGLEQIGQKPSTNGSFFDHFNSSVKQLTELDGGEQLPEGGNILPQVLLSSFDQANLLELQSLANNTSANKIAMYTFNEGEQVANLFDSEEVQDQLKTIPVTIASSIHNFTTSQDSLNALTKTKAELTDGLDTLLARADRSSFVKFVETSSITSPTKIQQSTLLHPLYEQSRFLTSEAPVSEAPAGALLNSQIKQHASVNNSIESLDKSVRNNSLDHFLDDKSDIKFRNQMQSADIEFFQQTLSATKSDPILQTTNPVSIHDSAQRLNIGAITDYTVNAPLPLNLKQISNANLEIITQSPDQSLFQNIKWLIGNKIQNANITVYPESLGHVNVSLNLEDSKLTINFLANSAVSKEVIETNLPSLREHLTNSGINLQDVNVSSRFPSHAEHHSQYSESENLSSSNQDSESLSLNDENESVLSDKHIEVQSQLYLIDAYA